MRDVLKPILHPEFSYKTYIVGKEKMPLLVVDNFIKDAQSLVDFCLANNNFTKSDRFYPGLRMEGPQKYMAAMHFYLGELFHAIFGLQKDKWQSGRSLYSMVVLPPEQLNIQQCIPHVDSFSRSAIACVHFLCDDTKGGTSLYRHKKTGFECIDEQRVEEYNQVAIAEGVLDLPQKSYMNGSNYFFKQIACVDAKFNRLVVYPSAVLHSGNIAPDFDFDPNPVSGRLTLNSFITGK